MKRLFSILAITGLMAFGTANATTFATTTTATTVVSATQDEAQPEAAAEEASFHQELKKRFIEGGPGFMGIVLLCLILGLAIAIERIIFLNLSTTNTKKLTQSVEDALSSGGVDAAKEVCRNTKGPVASIFYQGLDRTDEGIEAAEKAGVDGNYSLKPTFFGLLIDKDVAYKLIREVVAKAASFNNFVRIDMEDSPCTDLEIELFRKLKEEFPANVGLVFQSYLKRTHQDIKNLKDLNSEDNPLNFRLCKGIYVEPSSIAYKKYEEINAHFLDDIELMFQENMYPAIATHDKPIIDGAYELIEKYKVSKEKYEFQMLYGVTPALRKSILENGHRMRVYVPFGKQWFGYCTRRVKENPQMANVILKALFFKG